MEYLFYSITEDLEVCADCEAALDKVEKVAQPEMLRGGKMANKLTFDLLNKLRCHAHF